MTMTLTGYDVCQDHVITKTMSYLHSKCNYWAKDTLS